MPNQMIYDVGAIPQITGSIDTRLAAASVPFEPLRVDPTLYKNVMDAEIERQKNEFNKAELQYKKDVLNANAEQFWAEKNSKLASDLLDYHSGHISKAKSGEIDSPGISIPYFNKTLSDYSKRYLEAANTYKGEELFKIGQKLLLEKMSNPDYQKSVQAAINWETTLRTINDISNGKNKAYTTKNIDWNKFNALQQSLNDENIPVDPNDLQIRNFLIEDKDKLINQSVTSNIKISKTSELVPIDGKDISRVYEISTSPMDMYKAAMSELSTNAALINQLGADYKFNGVKDEELTDKVSEYLSKEVIHLINKNLGTNYTSENELPTEPYKKLISQSSLGQTLASLEKAQEQKTKDKLRILEKQQSNALEKGAAQQEDALQRIEAQADAKLKVKQASPGSSSSGKNSKFFSSTGASGVTANRRATLDAKKGTLYKFIKESNPEIANNAIMDDKAAIAIEKTDIKGYEIIKETNDEYRIDVLDAGDGPTITIFLQKAKPGMAKVKKNGIEGISDLSNDNPLFVKGKSQGKSQNKSTGRQSNVWGKIAEQKVKGKK